MSIQSGRGKFNGHVNYSTLSSSAPGSNTRRPLQKYTKSSGPGATATLLEPLADLLASSCGCTVVATVSSGARYQGVLATSDIGPSGGSALLVVLVHPKLITRPLINEKSNADEDLLERLIIQAKDMIDVEVTTSVEANTDAKNMKVGPKKLAFDDVADAKEEGCKKEELAAKSVAEPVAVPKPISYSALTKQPSIGRTSASTAGPAKSPSKSVAAVERTLSGVHLKDHKLEESASPASSKFKIDRDISATHQFRERELQKWVPDEGSVEVTLEDTSSKGEWDQFKVNEEKFGVESTYDEHLYTTRVNTAAKNYHERLKRAQNIAREIEGLSTQDQHVLEERGVSLADDSGIDEEDKYSGVFVDTPALKVDTRGSDLMAALRKGPVASEKRSGTFSANTSPQPGSGTYFTPGQRAAQYHNDPAIVASSATKKTIPLQSAAVAPGATSLGRAKVEPYKLTAKGANTAASSVSPSSVAAQTAAVAPHKDSKESFRLNAQSEINSLKEFSASFKVPHKMPNDLLPILARDKSKQEEILKKQKSSKAASTSKEEPKDAASYRKLSTSTVEGGKEVSKFKLNPKAAAFTPSRSFQALPLLAHKQSVSSVSSPRAKNFKELNHTREKRNHVLTPLEIFKKQKYIPTAESKKKKLQRLHGSFNMFTHIKKEHEQKAKEGDSAPLVFPKLFMTPPTWDSTVEESYEKVIHDQCMSQAPMSVVPGMPFMGNPMMGIPGAMPQMGAGFSATGKYPPSMLPAMVQFQQQQMQVAMFYQMQAGAGRPPQMMYIPTGSDLSYMSPGFAVPGGMAHGHMSPTYTGTKMFSSSGGVHGLTGGRPQEPHSGYSHGYGHGNVSHESYDRREDCRDERHDRDRKNGRREYNGHNGNRRYYNQTRESYHQEPR
ncbi:hypothetical protein METBISCDRAFT_20992 [Metschnikowia bicuspidata]|uniref:LsmAD domain-containing protein n=1 Tax=Metschnikowia bicuspidata TaxID=27322 RepID=A0A4P9ZJM4_9ASCO|nr:hypothetical protein METBISCDRAFT_20992 [Metschnikowia bicuspidata]